MIANLILLSPTDLSSALDALDVPALFVYSSLDGAMSAADEVRRAWAETPVEVIGGTSHAVFTDAGGV